MRKYLLIAMAFAVAVTPTGVAAEPELAEEGGVVVTVTPVRPYQPGDLVWSTTPPTAQSVGALATGCERVPATGYVSTNVYADSNAHYANFWQWGGASSGQPFNWYVKRTDNTTVASGSSSGGSGQSSVAANVLYWKVQNRGSSPQAWNVCYDVL